MRLEIPQRTSEHPTIHAAWTEDADLRFTSTSGGAFGELSKVILSRGGVAYGALYDRNCVVRHACADDFDSLAHLRQSKYVQSEIGLVYRDVEEKLAEGYEVIFCGAPCQIAGLRAYLGKEYESLYLADFVCLGVNSPKAYAAWLDELEQRQGSRGTRVWFKYKDGGWKTSPKRTRIDFEDGCFIVQDGPENHYMSGYIDLNLYLRPSCSSCDFRGFPRQGDITMADFWGLDDTLDDDKGASMVMVNSPKGERLFTEAACNMRCEERSFDEIFAGNPRINKNPKPNRKSQLFLDALDSMGFEAAYAQYGRPSFGKFVCRKLHAVKRRIKRLLDSGVE